MRRLTRSLAAVSTAAALGLAACGGPGVPASPSDAVAQGLDARLQDGFSFALAFELTDAGRASLVRDNGEQMAQILEDGLLAGAYQPPDKLAISIGGERPWLEVRQLTEELYLRVDLEGLAEFGGEDMDLPSPVELQAMIGEMGLSAEIAAVAQAAVRGDWIGITGMTEEALAGIGQSLGVPMPTPDAQASEDIRDALEGAGLLDGEQLTQRYLIVTGGEGAYEVEVKARALVAALTEALAELEQYAEGFTATDMPDPDDVPETVTGITITVEDGKADLITFDVFEIGSAFDDQAMAEAGIGEGDAKLVIDFDDLDASRVAVPEGATTITLDALVQGLAPLFMGFLGGGLGQY